MKTLRQRMIDGCRSKPAGIILFTALSLATLLFISPQPGAIPVATPLAQPDSPGKVQITVKPSQTKFVQGGQGALYLDVAVKAPAMDQRIVDQRATDMIIVLDRSGSMASPEKMPYAKAAVRDLLASLSPRDRFALISFADSAAIDAPLAAVTEAQRQNLAAVVNAVAPAGGTNIGDGILSAFNMLPNNDGERARKVVLLSDGQTNQGIVAPEALARLAAQLPERGAVLSAIGMGLDFNETLMTQLADHGMGHYAFLENLAGLGEILHQDLTAARSIFANASTLELTLGNGVTIVDAAGYPIEHAADNRVKIGSGQLLAGTEKRFVITLSVPAQNAGSFSLGTGKLRYLQNGREYWTPIDTDLRLSVVAPEKRQEAVASIDQDVYRQSWLQNNLGLMQKKLSSWVKKGNKDQAYQAIDAYRRAVQAAEKENNIPLASPAMSSKLDDMKEKIEATFSGSADEQTLKQKRAAKNLHYGAIKEQRAVR